MIRGVIGATSSAFSAVRHGNRPAIVLIGSGNVRCGIDCRSLLPIAVSFRRQLRTDHLPDELMFVAQEQHHLSGRGDRLVRSLGCVPHWVAIANPLTPTISNPADSKRFALAMPELRSNRFKHVTEIQTAV
jgi:hypothetical protein